MLQSWNFIQRKGVLRELFFKLMGNETYNWNFTPYNNSQIRLTVPLSMKNYTFVLSQNIFHANIEIGQDVDIR